MLRPAALSSLAIIALSLSVWTWGYLIVQRPLDTSETAVVVGSFTAAVLLARWAFARRRARRSRGQLSGIAWWLLAPAVTAAGWSALIPLSPPPRATETDHARSVSELACTGDQPTVRAGDAVTLRAWYLAAPGARPSYAWTATAGTLAASGETARWTLDAALPGSYRAEARVTEAARTPVVCSLTVIVRGADDAWRAGPEAGFAFLLAGQQETPGYGLYSYLLLGAAPDESTQDRYLRTLDSYLRKMPHLTRLEQYLSPDQLNATYLPLTIPPGRELSARWLLDHYDFARARVVLRQLPGNLRRGPYFVSALRPLGKPSQDVREYLLQDLSTVPPHLIDSWVVEFLNQSAQERFWRVSTVEQLSLKIRTIIGVLSIGLPHVRSSLKDWIGVQVSVR